MALRSVPAFGVATTGPRSRAVGAPQVRGKRGAAPACGCEVRRIWPCLFSGILPCALCRRLQMEKAPRRVSPAGAFERGYCARLFRLTRGSADAGSGCRFAAQAEQLGLVLEHLDVEVVLGLLKALASQLPGAILVTDGHQLQGRHAVSSVVDVEGEGSHGRPRFRI